MSEDKPLSDQSNNTALEDDDLFNFDGVSSDKPLYTEVAPTSAEKDTSAIAEKPVSENPAVKDEKKSENDIAVQEPPKKEDQSNNKDKS